MKNSTATQRRRPPRSGFTIIECLVYLGVYAVLLGVGTAAFHHCFDNMKGLRRNSEDITRAVRAGEIWRGDIRGAVRAIQFEATSQTLRIPQRDHEVAYRFADAQILRQAGADAPWRVLLSKVQTSQMAGDPRAQVTAWRWELELQPARKAVRVRPLFTFLAVPGGANQP